ncbi:hypothetical protein [Streptomyces sp. NPDC053367]|uniref:hypothetical protein n=1 Tax=Streptomyces sp. NPDC053367 TaxID=3365700 RepID=UPI0037D5450F
MTDDDKKRDNGAAEELGGKIKRGVGKLIGSEAGQNEIVHTADQLSEEDRKKREEGKFD